MYRSVLESKGLDRVATACQHTAEPIDGTKCAQKFGVESQAELTDGTLVAGAIRKLEAAKRLHDAIARDPLEADTVLREQLASIGPSESILVPLSWFHENAGHAMMLEIEHQRDDNLTLRVFNLGAGMSYHTRASSLSYVQAALRGPT